MHDSLVFSSKNLTTSCTTLIFCPIKTNRDCDVTDGYWLFNEKGQALQYAHFKHSDSKGNMPVQERKEISCLSFKIICNFSFNSPLLLSLLSAYTVLFMNLPQLKLKGLPYNASNQTIDVYLTKSCCFFL